MTFAVTDNCIKCKYTDCVEVCPVDCFYEGENMLVIHPDECIDCGVCVPECPAEAIFADNDPAIAPEWLALNRRYAALWPSITRRKDPLPDADALNGAPDKLRFFSPAPGDAEADDARQPKEAAPADERTTEAAGPAFPSAGRQS